MKFSVVICTYNRPELVSECLSQLSPGAQSISSDLYEVIVSDDNKNTITKDLIQEKFPWVKWVKGPEKGFSANRNNGARLASGEWLLLLDDDCLPDKNWIKGYADAILANPAIKVFEGKTIADRPRERFDEEAPINETGGKFWGCNQCVEKNFYFDVGGMPEVFGLYMEDVEFRVRVLKSGAKIYFAKDALIVHPWRNVRPLSKQVKVLDNVILFLKLHPEEATNFTFGKLFKSSLYKTIFELKLLASVKFKGTGYYIGKMALSYYRAFYLGFAVLFKTYK